CYGHQYCPDILFAAFDMDYMNIIVGGSEKWQTRGMDYLTPTSCVFSRQIIGFFEELLGNNIRDPSITHVIHTNFCSGDYHSIEILKHYLGMKLIPFTLPYKITPGSLKLVVENLKSLIGIFSGSMEQDYDPERLRAAIHDANLLSEAFEKLSRVRVWGLDKLRGLFTVEIAPWGKKLGLLNELIADLSSNGGNGSGENNIVITGSPLMHGDRFLRLLESLEVPIRFFDFYFGDARALRRVPTSKEELPILGGVVDFNDPIEQLAAYYLEVLSPERMVQGPVHHLNGRIEGILQYGQFLEENEKIDGIISHVLKFCDVYGTDRSKFKEFVQKQHGIPVLDIERDFSTSSVGQMTTRIEAFLEMVAGPDRP
ncbi:MAG: 2-hydroxyacyl-CoA dehydratase family protein, partial [Promethearchaeota archaeon]